MNKFESTDGIAKQYDKLVEHELHSYFNQKLELNFKRECKVQLHES